MLCNKLTLRGMDQITEHSIWDDIVLPDGLNKDILISTILKDNGEFPLLTYLNDPFTLKEEIELFFRKYYRNFEKLYEAEVAEYNMIYNLDVKSTITDDYTKDRSVNDKVDHTNDVTVNVESSDKTTGDTSGSSETKTAAYDSENYTNREKVEQLGNSTINGTSSKDDTTNQIENTERKSEENETSNNTHVEIRQGNQGITTSEQMLWEERYYRMWNIYSYISQTFRSEGFVVLIYG